MQCNNLHRKSAAKTNQRSKVLHKKPQKTQKKPTSGEEKEPFVTECSGCNEKVTLYGNFCPLHTVKNNGFSYAVPCNIISQGHPVPVEQLDGFMCNLCSIGIENTRLTLEKQLHDPVSKSNDCLTEKMVYPNEMADIENQPIKITDTPVESNDVASINSKYDMKSLAHELIEILPYHGWTVAFSPGNTIQLFLDWSDEGEFIKKINIFETKVEIVVNKVTVETIRNMGMDTVEIQELCDRVVQMHVCRGLTDPAVVAFCQQEQLKMGSVATNSVYHICREQGKLVVRSLTCMHT